MTKRIFNFNKLVRDKIPQMMRNKSCNVHDHLLAGDELISALKIKLLEEANEVAEAKSVDDLKDRHPHGYPSAHDSGWN